jgi:hypothetical protein
MSARGTKQHAACGLYVVLVLLTIFVHLHVNTDVTNDHAGYLAMARQIVYGDWPIRDFRDDGSLLQILLSAAVQKIGGFHLLGEMLLSWAFFAAANCLTFLLALRLSGSRAAAAVAAILATLLVPRPYAYPKLFVYPLAILVLWRYADRPQMRSLAAVAAIAALAFLFRIDHGVVITATSIVAVAAIHSARPRALITHGLVFSAWLLVFALPQLAYVTWTVGLRRYLESITTFGAYANATREPFPPVLSVDDGLLTQANAVTFLIYLFLIVAGVVLVYVGSAATPVWSRRKDMPRETLYLLVVVVMWVLMLPMLARGQYYTRISEIGQPIAILGSWLWVRWVARNPGRRLRVSAGGMVLAATVCALFLREPLVLFFTTPNRVFAGAPFQSQRLKEWATRAPIDGFAPAEVEGDRWIVRYAHVCTKPTDRLLVTWFGPEVYFFAGRAFAGDRWVYLPFDNSPEQQKHIVERLRAQSVPIVFVDFDDYEEFRSAWPEIAAYLQEAYDRAADVTIGPHPVTRVLTHKHRLPSRRLSFENLPCFD